MGCISVTITPLEGHFAITYLNDSEQVQLYSSDGLRLAALAIDHDGNGLKVEMTALPMMAVSISPYCGIVDGA